MKTTKSISIHREADAIWIVEGKRCETGAAACKEVMGLYDANGYETGLGDPGEINAGLESIKIGQTDTSPIPQDEDEDA